MRNRFYQESSAHTSGASLSDRETDGEDAHTSGDDKPKLKESISFKKVITRTLTACLLAGLYLTLLMSGHLYCIIAMALTQVLTMQVNNCVDISYKLSFCLVFVD